MRVSDYIVEYLISFGVTDVFGYPGGMVTDLMDALGKRDDRIHTHLTYHEQGASFAACGYAQAGGKLGVAFATSGPGATNLITGICNAYFDSIPVLFLTGQVNTNEAKSEKKIRQCGFQETDIVSMVRDVTKYAAYIENACKVRKCLEKAVYEATHGRKGAVLLDIPIDVMRAEITSENAAPFVPKVKADKMMERRDFTRALYMAFKKSKKPVLLIGNGIKLANAEKKVVNFVERTRIPVVSSMIACDVMMGHDLYYGFIGAYGDRTANFIVAKSDLILSLGSRLDIRQIGRDRNCFASDARIYRVDIDKNELEYKVHEDEVSICADCNEILDELVVLYRYEAERFGKWEKICDYIKVSLSGIDETKSLRLVKEISKNIQDNALITTDVGQNQVWIAQAFQKKKEQRILFSGSNGAMGCALPLAVGAAIQTGKTVYSFQGDGGFQMNLQELQTVVREGLPIKIIIFNNHSLGMIRHFQEMYYDKNYFMTVEGSGYANPDFRRIADAYGLRYTCIRDVEECGRLFLDNKAEMIEVVLDEDTYVYPKLKYGKPNQDQEPLIDRGLYLHLMDDEAIQNEIRKHIPKNCRSL